MFDSLPYLDQPPAVKDRLDRMKAREVILEVAGLTKKFRTGTREVTALEDISFQTHRREFLCIVGPSGCGKSTLVRILAGLEMASGGQVLLDGHPVKGPGRERGMVFQGYTLFPWLTVRGNVMFGLRMNNVSRAEARKQADEWLGLIGLEKFADAYPHQLSGGMKQRAAIARALALEPQILLMDEPFGALDAITRSRLQVELDEIWKRTGVTIILVTHSIPEAVFLGHRVMVMGDRGGRVREIVDTRAAETWGSRAFEDLSIHLRRLLVVPEPAPTAPGAAPD
jgi:NitT/TauT family transport system ATP-binding protein